MVIDRAWFGLHGKRRADCDRVASWPDDDAPAPGCSGATPFLRATRADWDGEVRWYGVNGRIPVEPGGVPWPVNQWAIPAAQKALGY